MPNEAKPLLLSELRKRYGRIHKLEGSQSLYEIGEGAARIYIRYSKIHERNEAFYGLRQEDLHALAGLPSVICFLWNDQVEPLFIPFVEYEDIFHGLTPANDGQYKLAVYPRLEGTEIYIARAGRFNVESNLGWDALESIVDSSKVHQTPALTHSQIQTLLGVVGTRKGYDIWIPPNDRPALDWGLAQRFSCRDVLPDAFNAVQSILQEIDVIWIQKGSSLLKALFEVEYSTPIYSGLLRFNDIHLTSPHIVSRFSVVSNDTRRSLFIRQLNRPTFRASGLSELCTFLEYANVYWWFNRAKT
jgi:hypothetical protein